MLKLSKTLGNEKTFRDFVLMNRKAIMHSITDLSEESLLERNLSELIGYFCVQS